jgi:hypothetical protein
VGGVEEPAGGVTVTANVTLVFTGTAYRFVNRLNTGVGSCVPRVTLSGTCGEPEPLKLESPL